MFINIFKAYWPNIGKINITFKLARLLYRSNSILDLGCGSNSPLQYINAYKVGVDGHRPSIILAKKNSTHNKFYDYDIQKIGNYFKNKTFDSVVALDLIEHLTKKDGFKLLAQMEKIAKKNVIIFTPNGFIKQQSVNGDLQEHKSGWTPSDFRKHGYEVYGALGAKWLRGEKHTLKYKPKIISGLISEFTNLYIINRPELASALLCIKKLSRNNDKK